MAKKKDDFVEVPEIKLVRQVFVIKGLSQMITRRMPIKVPKGQDKAKKYVDEEEFQSSIYYNGKKAGCPPVAFKHAAVSACRSLTKQQMTMVLAAQTHHVIGSWTEIKGSKPKMRQDVVRVPPGSPNAVNRIRAEFWPWEVEVEVLYNSAVIRVEQLVALYNLAGFAVGVFEWRPEKGGTFGMYEVKSVRRKRG